MRITPIASGSKGNAYLISDGISMLLLDAGIPVGKIEVATKFNLSKISAALITHRHNDHAAALSKLAERLVSIYAPQDVFDSKDIRHPNCKSVQHGDIFTTHDLAWTISVFDCQHDVPCVGYLITNRRTSERLLYFTDTCYLKNTFPPCQYIMAECNNSIDEIDKSIADGRTPAALKSRLLKSHMSIDTLEDMLKANDLSKLKTIYLLHLSDANSNAAEFKSRIQRLTGSEVIVC